MHPKLRLCLARLAAPIMLAVAGASLSTVAQATAMSMGSASATLEVVDIVCTEGVVDPCDSGDLIFDLEANFVSLEDPIAVGSSSATATGSTSPTVDPLIPDLPVPLGVGDVISNSADADATADPNGFADALTLTDMVIAVENLSVDDEYEILFDLSYEVSASASVTDAVMEFAFADASVDILDVLGDVDEIFFATADSEFGPPADSDTATLSFSLLLFPGDSNTLTMLVDAEAFAAAVPEPGTVALLFLGLLGLGFARHHAAR